MSSKDYMFAKVVLASKPTNGAPPIITMHLRYPRFIHSEIMTHRVFSRNARSSRAVPIKTMLKELRENCVVPWHWGSNIPGMQAGEECNTPIELYEYQQGPDERYEGLYDFTREAAWLKARDAAVTVAEAYAEAGYHKQVANRLLEPFMWIDTLITSTSWANFLHLRDHEAAEPHFQDLAKMVKVAIENATYQTLNPSEWHLPYITEEDRLEVGSIVAGEPNASKSFTEILLKISTARCARISYVAFDGNGSIAKEIERHDSLVGSQPLHASPAEHQAKSDTKRQSEDGIVSSWRHPHQSGNLAPGWRQYRKMLEGEYVKDQV